MKHAYAAACAMVPGALPMAAQARPKPGQKAEAAAETAPAVMACGAPAIAPAAAPDGTHQQENSHV
jgi:hypothetical protein